MTTKRKPTAPVGTTRWCATHVLTFEPTLGPPETFEVMLRRPRNWPLSGSTPAFRKDEWRRKLVPLWVLHKASDQWRYLTSDPGGDDPMAYAPPTTGRVTSVERTYLRDAKRITERLTIRTRSDVLVRVRELAQLWNVGQTEAIARCVLQAKP